MSKNHDHLDKKLQQVFRDKRTASSLSQERLAQKSERRMSADRLHRPAKAFGVQPVELSRFPEEPQHDAGEVDTRLPAERDAYLTLLEEGVALHKAFISIRAAQLRKSVLALAMEYAKSDGVN